MSSTKRYLPILAVGLVFVLSSTLTAQTDSSQTDKQGFVSTIGFTNPCNQAVVQASAPTKIDYHENSTGEGPHANIHFQIEANGQDSAGNPYRISLEANGQYDAIADWYDLPFHSVWAGQQGAPSFSLNGMMRVFVKNGELNGSSASAVDPASCMN